MKIIATRKVDDSGHAMLRAVYSPSGREIVGCGGLMNEPGTVVVWDAADLGRRTEMTLSDKVATTIALAPDHQTLAICCQTCDSVELWNYKTGTFIARHAILPRPYKKSVAGHFIDSTLVEMMTFSRDSARLALGCWDCSAKVLDLETGNLSEVRPKGMNNVEFVAFSDGDPERLTTGTYQRLNVWDLTTGTSIVDLKFPDDDGWVHRSLDDQGHVLSLSYKGVLKRWNDKLECIEEHIIRYKQKDSHLALSSRHGLLAIGQKDGRVVFWNLNKGTSERSLKVASEPFLSLNFSPDQQRLCVVTMAGENRVMEVEWGE